MKIYHLESSQTVQAPLVKVFEFFSKPENLEKLTPSNLKFRILTPSPISMEKGRLIEYAIQISGFSQRWTTLITEFDPPHRFVDECLKGPYSMWHHTHEFQSVKEGTLIVDKVRYIMPFGFLGRWIHFLFVRFQLKHIFKYRKSIIQKLFDKTSS